MTDRWTPVAGGVLGRRSGLADCDSAVSREGRTASISRGPRLVPEAPPADSADDRKDRRAVVVRATGRSLDHVVGHLEVVVGVVRGPGVGDDDLDPDLAGVAGDGLAVGSIGSRGTGSQADDRHGAVAVVSDLQVL